MWGNYVSESESELESIAVFSSSSTSACIERSPLEEKIVCVLFVTVYDWWISYCLLLQRVVFRHLSSGSTSDTLHMHMYTQNLVWLANANCMWSHQGVQSDVQPELTEGYRWIWLVPWWWCLVYWSRWDCLHEVPRRTLHNCWCQIYSRTKLPMELLRPAKHSMENAGLYTIFVFSWQAKDLIVFGPHACRPFCPKKNLPIAQTTFWTGDYKENEKALKC